MTVEQTAKAARTFWFRPNGGDFYLIPDDVELPPGDLEIRTLMAAKRMVDESALEPWIADSDTVREHLKDRVNDGLQKFTEELGEAWRRGVAMGAASATEPKASSEKERANEDVRKIQEAATSIVTGLKELSEKLEQAVRTAAEEGKKAKSDASPQGVELDGDARADDSKQSEGEARGTEHS